MDGDWTLDEAGLLDEAEGLALAWAPQPELNARMRHVLVEWMLDVCIKFYGKDLLDQECDIFSLSVQILDSFLAIYPNVARARFQLVGVAAMMLSSKMLVVCPAGVRDWVYICDKAYTRKQVVDMERLVHQRLRGRMHMLCVPQRFLERLRADGLAPPASPADAFHVASAHVTSATGLLPTVVAAIAVGARRARMLPGACAALRVSEAEAQHHLSDFAARCASELRGTLTSLLKLHTALGVRDEDPWEPPEDAAMAEEQEVPAETAAAEQAEEPTVQSSSIVKTVLRAIVSAVVGNVAAP